MRLAVISDTHLGDPMCRLVQKVGDGYQTGPAFEPLLRAIGSKLDYLVLIGDILDFSMASYADVYKAAGAFFSALKGKARYIVYVLGNHDFDVWTTVEYQVNIINRLARGKAVRPFHRTVPAVFDDRPKRRGRQELPTVDPRDDGGPGYGGLFLDRLVGSGGSEQEPRFIFAYPNAYLVTKDNELVMMTHGHYFEGYWSALFDFAQGILREDLKDSSGRAIDNPTLEQLVAINFPLCQLSCSGVGQAGPLSKAIDDVVAEVKREHKIKPLTKTRRYIDNAIDFIDEHTQIGGWLLDRLDVDERLMKAAKKALLKKLSAYEPARHRIPFLTDRDTKERFQSYVHASILEILKLNGPSTACALPPIPDYVIFGHTHRPIKWQTARAANPDYDLPWHDKTIRLFNTGAWINRDLGGGIEAFSGAEVFLYDSDDPVGMKSIPISELEAVPEATGIAVDPVVATDDHQ